MSYNLRLLISCPDKKGLIAAISSFIAMHDGNILSADQYVSDSRAAVLHADGDRGRGFRPGRDEFDAAFAPLARRHGMDWRVALHRPPKRMAILVSRYDHCLIDLLWRWDAGELDAEIPLVVSNHPDLATRAEAHGIPFHHLPVDEGDEGGAGGRGSGAPARARRRRRGARPLHADPLARRSWTPTRRAIINIHHSFLPAFAGADPTARRTSAGVKIDRRDRALRHGGARRRADHPPGRRRTSPTATRSRTWCASAARSSGGCWPARCAGTWRTGCWSTAAARWSSSSRYGFIG